MAFALVKCEDTKMKKPDIVLSSWILNSREGDIRSCFSKPG